MSVPCSGGYLAALAIVLSCAFPQVCQAETLLDLYHRTLAGNPALKSREYSVDRAQAQKEQAFSRLLPQISAVGSYSLNDYHQRAVAARQPAVSEQYDGLRGTIQLRQALFDLASFFRWQGADAVVLQSRDELEAARMAVAGELVDRYLSALEAADEMAYVQAEKQATASQLQRLRQMHERQLAKVTDLYEVEAYYQSLNTKEIQANNARAVALERLREVSGVPVAEVKPLRRETFPATPRSMEQWVADATSGNPNLTALQHAIAAADKQVTGSQSEHAPQVALLLSETYADVGFDNRTQPAYNVGSASVQLTVPIYEGGRVQAGVREAVARQQIAREQFEQKRRETERETRTAYLDMLAGLARIDSTALEARAQQKAADAQQRGYELGVTTLIDLLDTRRRLLRARSDQAKARYDYIRALLALRVWAGRLDEDDIAEISGWMG